MNSKPAPNPSRLFVLLITGIFFVICVSVSWSRWANFEYRTFDLAFYNQALWQLIHGRFQVSLLNVPMLGNHADPIVFLATPLYALLQHPMLLPILQIAALASMAPTGWRICRRLGLSEISSALMASALLLTPATGFVALHEFHPEALAAPLILLMLEARLRDSLTYHWFWFIAALACKENIALLLVAYCAMENFTDSRHRSLTWNILPGIVALGWFFIFIKLLAPILNAGNVEFASLYNHLGNSPTDILWKGITEPHLALGALRNALTGGNLVWAMLIPFLGLPILRPRWFIVAAPILFQHLLSWRSSEWTINFHYAAPLIPLFWIASVEAIRKLPTWLPGVVVFACIAGQCLTGPALEAMQREPINNAWKQALLNSIAPDSSVVASMPYLTHLDNREKLYSLHHILKGLKTLSGAEYKPPQEVDAVVIDYGNRWTFDPVAGYYHPKMKTADGTVIPSSDQLLHQFLRKEQWTAESINELTVYHRHAPIKTQPTQPGMGIEFDAHTRLLVLEKSGPILSNEEPLTFHLRWSFHGERDWIPWMILRFKSVDKNLTITKGLCAPEATDDGQCHEEIWHVIRPPQLPIGTYTVEAVFFENSRLAWIRKSGPPPAGDSISCTVPLGSIQVK